ncbi:MAG: methyltransferase domain-containing protein [Candidatus Rokubacteria bacterium]|nr:methyltransferase domain-containing protein [Candidatus Rokubacteria bacterium]
METSRREAAAVGLFDTLAPTYDAWYGTPLGRLVDRLEREAVLGLVGEKPGVRALDLSCGTGRYALALARRGLRVVGVDVSEPMLLVARAKAREAGCDLHLVRADAHALPLRAGAVDLVTVILGLEFAGEPRRVLEECHRVLVPGGRLVAAILARAGLWTAWRRLKRLVGPSVWRGATFLSPDELRDLLRARGFTEPRWRSAVHFLPLFWPRSGGWLERWEAIGARWMPGRATFVAVAARRA